MSIMSRNYNKLGKTPHQSLTIALMKTTLTINLLSSSVQQQVAKSPTVLQARAERMLEMVASQLDIQKTPTKSFYNLFNI